MNSASKIYEFAELPYPNSSSTQSSFPSFAAERGRKGLVNKEIGKVSHTFMNGSPMAVVGIVYTLSSYFL